MRKLLTALLLLASFGVNAQLSPNGVGTAIASAAYTATTVNSNDILTPPGFTRGALIMNVSAFTSGTYTCTLQGKDPASGAYYNILATTAIGSASTTVLKVGPALTAAANSIANDLWPRVFRVSCTGATTPVMTFSVGYSLN